MFKKILIANRGEIACRVAATARRMGVRTVAVYSDADANAKHVQACDEAVHIGGNSPKESYLRADAIIAAAVALGAEAIHPGYGFLSENEDFADACEKAGLVFIGPPASAIRAMGLKAASKQLMEKASVPLVPGYHGKDQSLALLKSEAERIGYPILIKASAGGGGKGMRAVLSADQFDDALASCQREALNSFGDDAVLIERYVQKPRHVEIQVFFDQHGNGVYMFERDCSVQRRHQKVLEEAPAPGMSPARRREMGEAAVAAARAVGYVGAGTVEFIVEPDRVDARGVGAFYFMEMNTRLQVEHPVTEAITGYDLVEWQLRVAAGEPLPVRQDDLEIHGHAIEARICAENPDNNFLPATGKLHVLHLPEHVAFLRNADGERLHDSAPVRVDAGVRLGDDITPYYDSMIAKLIVWGSTREQALARMDAALAQTHIVGPHTNVAFLRRTVRSQSFAMADLDTGLIERERVALLNVQDLPLKWAAAGAVARLLADERVTHSDDPWSHTDGWRMNGRLQRRVNFRQDDQVYPTSIEYTPESEFLISVDGTYSRMKAVHQAGGFDLTLDGERKRVVVYRVGDGFAVHANEGAALIELDDLIAHAGDDTSDSGRLAAPMPGKVIALLAKAGESVKRGQALAVMEAMKMEHTIAAPADGIVSEVLYAVGDQVDEGAELVRFST
jgi:3-methylcrotonyl-CoA carboxylase alpha subunit